METNRRDFIKAGVLAAATATHALGLTSRQYQIGAYYFPNFHVDPRNEAIHGKGWTEWELLKRGEPKFAGHHQPKVPAWGAGDEADPKCFERKIDAAAAGGLGHFMFDWYWYEGKPFLNRAVELGYLGASNKDKVQFCLMWANHDWENLMPSRLHEQPRPLLYPGTYSAEEFGRITDYIISHYFTETSYLRIDGAPYFSIYELKHLIERMGGVDTARGAIDRFRNKVRAAGLPDVHLNAVAWGLAGLPNLPKLLPSLGIRSVTSYTWAHHCDLQAFPTVEYASMCEEAEGYWRRAQDLFGVPYHTDVSMGWDPSPRSCQSERWEQGEYPFTSVVVGNTPQLFQTALERAKAYIDSHTDIPKILTINSWNEWTEGSHLEPEMRYGMDYLNAIRNVFETV